MARPHVDGWFGTERPAVATAYLDRSAAAFKRTVDRLAWGSYAWFVSEPEGLVHLVSGGSSLEA